MARNPDNKPEGKGSVMRRVLSGEKDFMSTASDIYVTPIIRSALRSFGRARAAIISGNVDQMIGHLTRGAALLEAIDQVKPPARRSPRKKTAS